MTFRAIGAALLLTSLPIPVWSAPPLGPTMLTQGAKDFDFQVGDWRVHHRVKQAGSGSWVEFKGDCSNRPLMGGLANVEDNIFYKPGGISRGVALRAYDPATRQWAIWWIDGRTPLGAIDPPVKGHFVDGIGTFYSDGELGGRAVRTRFLWSHITTTSARWEQAYSFDAGKTWDTNWIMQFVRRGPTIGR